MRFQGRLRRDGKWWLAEVPVFDAMTQGRTRAEALTMMADWFQTMVNKRGVRIEIHARRRRDDFEVGSSDVGPLIALLLQRRRQQSGLSLRDAAARLGAKSRNTYARYERGQAAPSAEKLDQLLRAVAPERDFVIADAAILGSG